MLEGFGIKYGKVSLCEFNSSYIIDYQVEKSIIFSWWKNCVVCCNRNEPLETLHILLDVLFSCTDGDVKVAQFHVGCKCTSGQTILGSSLMLFKWTFVWNNFKECCVGR